MLQDVFSTEASLDKAGVFLLFQLVFFSYRGDINFTKISGQIFTKCFFLCKTKHWLINDTQLAHEAMAQGSSWMEYTQVKKGFEHIVQAKSSD